MFQNRTESAYPLSDSQPQSYKPRELYEGLLNFTPELFSPTMDELNTFLGRDKLSIDPLYTETLEGGVRTVDVEIWGTFRSPDGSVEFKDKFRTLKLKDQNFVSKSGKTQMINSAGQSGWFDFNDPKELPAFLAGLPEDKSYLQMYDLNVKVAKVNEAYLIKFLLDLLRLTPKKGMEVELLPDEILNAAAYFNTDLLFNNNFSELNDSLKNTVLADGVYKNSYVRVLAGVRENEGKYYQTFYNDFDDYIRSYGNKDGSTFVTAKSIEDFMGRVLKKMSSEYPWKVVSEITSDFKVFSVPSTVETRPIVVIKSPMMSGDLPF